MTQGDKDAEMESERESKRETEIVRENELSLNLTANALPIFKPVYVFNRVHYKGPNHKHRL